MQRVCSQNQQKLLKRHRSNYPLRTTLEQHPAFMSQRGHHDIRPWRTVGWRENAPLQWASKEDKVFLTVNAPLSQPTSSSRRQRFLPLQLQLGTPKCSQSWPRLPKEGEPRETRQSELNKCCIPNKVSDKPAAGKTTQWCRSNMELCSNIFQN